MMHTCRALVVHGRVFSEGGANVIGTQLLRDKRALRRALLPAIVTVVVALAVLGARAISAQDKYTVQVPGGLAFSEFRGYEDWQTVSVSQNEGALAVILANPTMIDAYRADIPDNGKPFPDGSKMAKIHWKPEKSAESPRADDEGSGVPCMTLTSW
jgi:Cytochrome P460